MKMCEILGFFHIFALQVVVWREKKHVYVVFYPATFTLKHLKQRHDLEILSGACLDCLIHRFLWCMLF